MNLRFIITDSVEVNFDPNATQSRIVILLKIFFKCWPLIIIYFWLVIWGLKLSQIGLSPSNFHVHLLFEMLFNLSFSISWNIWSWGSPFSAFLI